MPKPHAAVSLCVDATVNALVTEVIKQYRITRADAEVAAGHMINLATAIGGKHNFEVAVQGGTIAYLSAAKRFDPHRGVPFVAFAKFWMRGWMIRGIDRDEIEGVGFDDEHDTDDLLDARETNHIAPLDAAIEAEVEANVATFLSRLAEPLRTVATDVVVNGDSRAAVSRRMGVSRMAITKAMQRVTVLAAQDLKAVIEDAIAA